MINSASQQQLGMAYERRLAAIPTVCLFCGDVEEQRYMCSKCQQKSLFECFWELAVQAAKNQADRKESQ